MKPYSIDLRQRVLDAVDRGTPRRLIVEQLEVSLSTIKRYLKQRHVTGQLAAKPIPGRTPKSGASLDADLPVQLAAHDDFTRDPHCQHEPGDCSPGLDAEIKQTGATERKETDRAALRDLAPYLPAERLIF